MNYFKPTCKLFENQKNNINALLQRPRALLTDKCGAGKTTSVLYAFNILKVRGKVRNLIVFTPLSAYAKEVWKKEILKFTTFKAISIEDLEKQCRQDANPRAKLEKILEVYDVIYCKHSHVKQCLNLLTNICSRKETLVCIDEVHALKNPKSELSNLFRIAVNHANSLWAITGSSVSKSLEDFYNIMNIVRPWYLGTFEMFRRDYCTYVEQVIGRKNGHLVKVQKITGVKNEETFRKKIEPVVIFGEAFTDVKYDYIDYTLSDFEQSLYRKIAKGIYLEETMDAEDWLNNIINKEEKEEVIPHIKSVDLFSSRFIYLQAAADGVLNADGTLNKTESTKLSLLISKLDEIVSKKQSAIVYFDFYSALHAVQLRLQQHFGSNVVLLESSGNVVLKDEDVTEAKCKTKPHIILQTKAASESSSYYFINNVIFFHVPTVPSVMVQTLGRITRKNTIYPNDLHCYIFRSENIDLYKLYVISSKCYQMEQVQGEEKNVPDTYKQEMSKNSLLQRAKKTLLWLKN